MLDTTRSLLFWHLICTVAQHSARNLGNLSRKQPQITIAPNTQRDLMADHQLLNKGSETKRSGICIAKGGALLRAVSGQGRLQDMYFVVCARYNPYGHS
jgi:hypothetical protein